MSIPVQGGPTEEPPGGKVADDRTREQIAALEARGLPRSVIATASNYTPEGLDSLLDQEDMKSRVALARDPNTQMRLLQVEYDRAVMAVPRALGNIIERIDNTDPQSKENWEASKYLTEKVLFNRLEVDVTHHSTIPAEVFEAAVVKLGNALQPTGTLPHLLEGDDAVPKVEDYEEPTMSDEPPKKPGNGSAG